MITRVALLCLTALCAAATQGSETCTGTHACSPANDPSVLSGAGQIEITALPGNQDGHCACLGTACIEDFECKSSFQFTFTVSGATHVYKPFTEDTVKLDNPGDAWSITLTADQCGARAWIRLDFLDASSNNLLSVEPEATCTSSECGSRICPADPI